MRIRILCHESQCAHVVHGGATRAEEAYKTFDVTIPDDLGLGQWLKKSEGYLSRCVVGVEILSYEDGKITVPQTGTT